MLFSCIFNLYARIKPAIADSAAGAHSAAVVKYEDKQPPQDDSKVHQEARPLASGFAMDSSRRPKLTTELEEEDGNEINMEDCTYPVDATKLHLSDKNAPSDPEGVNSKPAQMQEQSGPEKIQKHGIINADEPKGVQGRGSELVDKLKEEGEKLEADQPSVSVGILNNIIAEEKETLVSPNVERKGKLIIEEEIEKKKVHVWQLVSQQYS